MIHLVGVPVLRKNHKIKTTLLKLQARAVFSPCPYKGEINIDTTISFISFQYLLKNGIIDTADVLEKAQEMKKQEQYFIKKLTFDDLNEVAENFSGN